MSNYSLLYLLCVNVHLVVACPTLITEIIWTSRERMQLVCTEFLSLDHNEIPHPLYRKLLFIGFFKLRMLWYLQKSNSLSLSKKKKAAPCFFFINLHIIFHLIVNIWLCHVLPFIRDFLGFGNLLYLEQSMSIHGA